MSLAKFQNSRRSELTSCFNKISQPFSLKNAQQPAYFYVTRDCRIVTPGISKRRINQELLAKLPFHVFLMNLHINFCGILNLNFLLYNFTFPVVNVSSLLVARLFYSYSIQ